MDTDDSRSVDDLQVVTPIRHHRGTADDGSITVLHVEDNENFADLTATYLERITDRLDVTTAVHPDDGLDVLEGADVHCIVSDYDMPGMDGLELLEAVRREHADLPFILFTGKGSEEIAAEAISTGVTDYMQKAGGSDQFEVLANRIENAVEQYWTEQELWTALQWYQRLVEQNLVGMYLVQDETFVYVNERMADIFGYTQEELIGRSALEIIAEEDHEVVVDNLRKRERGEVDAIRYRITGERKDGDRITVEAQGGVIEFAGEPAVMGLLLGRDE